MLYYCLGPCVMLFVCEQYYLPLKANCLNGYTLSYWPNLHFQFLTFGHSGAQPEHQSSRMSEIKNGRLGLHGAEHSKYKHLTSDDNDPRKVLKNFFNLADYALQLWKESVNFGGWHDSNGKYFQFLLQYIHHRFSFHISQDGACILHIIHTWLGRGMWSPVYIQLHYICGLVIKTNKWFM